MRKTFSAVASATVLTFSLVADARLSTTGGATGGFKATGPAGLSIDARTSDVSVADDNTTITVTVGLTNIDTGMTLRNKHTREDLEAEKYPTATLKVARADLRWPADGAEANGQAKGTITIHGVTKDVRIHYNAKNSGGVYDVKGSAKINVGDFGVKPRSYLGVSIKPDVSVWASFTAKDA